MALLPLWFEYLLLVLMILLLGLSITNAIHYGRSINDPNPHPPITPATAHTMIWINIILALASITVIILLILRLTIFREDSHITKYRRSKHQQRLALINAGLNCESFVNDSDKKTCLINLRAFETKSKNGVDCTSISTAREQTGDPQRLYEICLQNQTTV
jgi:hypothetical protein